MLVKETIKVVGQGTNASATASDRNNKQVTFKNYVLFTDSISKTNNAHIDNAKDLDVVMLMYSNNYVKTSRSL